MKIPRILRDFEYTKQNHYPKDHPLESKITQYAKAMYCYESNRIYQKIQRLVSVFIVALQTISLISLLVHHQECSVFGTLLVLITAYIVTDFINGLVHMYMDNNTNYSSIVGPFVAAFHLHHAHAVYQEKHPLQVYFYESGTKFWLLIYLIIIVSLQLLGQINTTLLIGLVAFSIFSSLAEVSHYWCHNATKKNKIILWLQNHHILLSKQHHLPHHHSDNIQYAFLNGVSDPLLNIIARTLFNGYKTNADKHAKIYRKENAYKLTGNAKTPPRKTKNAQYIQTKSI